jgi:serine/threonine protein kinase
MVTAGLELPPGTAIDRRYRIQRVLGRGGFGRTYLAVDERRFGELCVLKEFVPNGQGDPVVAQKLHELFQREASILHQLDHPQIPKFFAVFEEEGRLFIVQEYIDGKTYWSVLRERQQQGKAFTEVEVVQWLQDLLQVLDYLHQQSIVHRDISPDNIMLPRGRPRPVLIDFGVVKQAATQWYGDEASPDDFIQASVSVGKFGYAPYEQIRMGQCSPRSDLYALAVTAVVLLTGKSPNLLIDPKSLEWQWQAQVNISPGLVKILSTMMAEKPQDRYASANVILEELQSLENWQADQPPVHEPSAVAQQQVYPQEFILHSDAHPFREKAGQTLIPTCLAMTAADTCLEQVCDEPEPASLLPTQLEMYVGMGAKNRIRIDLSPSKESASDATTAIKDVVDMPPDRSLMTQARVFVAHQAEHALPSVSSIKRLLVLGCLALLPVGGLAIGIHSSYVAPLCRILSNCAEEQQAEVRYRQAVDQAAEAKTLAEKAQNVEDLQHARDRLVDAVAQLSSFVGSPKLYNESQQVLQSYQSLLSSIEDQLEKEARAAQLLNRAEAEAHNAAEQTQVAKTKAAYQAARLQWLRALATLQAIPSQTFVATQAAARSQEYKARLEAVNLRAGVQASHAHSDEFTFSPTSPARITQAIILHSKQPERLGAQAIASSPSASSQSNSSSSARSQSSSTQHTRNSKHNTPKPSMIPASSRRANPSQTAGRQTGALQISRTMVMGSATLSATQTLGDVSIWVDGSWTNPSGTFAANLVIQNRSSRAFGFVPLYAESRDANGQLARRRILFTGSNTAMIEPGQVIRGQLSLLDRSTSSPQNLTLVIQESTSGGRNFRIPF